ncbi:MAG: MBL fold metallo-hydrolase [Lachnospiraceae bacterium]|nr:MBL fold metallo-hydrolase [Lachnospiraceae bacterium]
MGWIAVFILLLAIGLFFDFYNIGVNISNKKTGGHVSAIPFLGTLFFVGALLVFPKTRQFCLLGIFADVTVYSIPALIAHGVKASKAKPVFRVVVLSEDTIKENAKDSPAEIETDAREHCPDLGAQHGLSLYIEYGMYKMLVDAGQSELFFENAGKLGIDLSRVDAAVLSHAHYDHADGFEKFFEVNKKAKLYVRKEAGECFYSKNDDGMKYIGPKKGMLEKYKSRIEYVGGEFVPVVCWSTYAIPHTSNGLDEIGKRAELYREVNGELMPDDFSHEQTLILGTQKGIVIISSCSHAGAENIIREARDFYCDENKEIDAFIGGFHLHKSSDEEILACAEALKKAGVKRIITGHCTGDHAFEILKRELGDRVEKMYSGMEIDFSDEIRREG